MIKEPQQKISQKAVKMWRLTEVITYFIILCILGVLVFLRNYYNWSNLVENTIYCVIILAIISFMIEVVTVPIYRQRTWRYEVDGNYIQLKYGGVLRKSHLIIPTVKVQYVNTSQGPLSRKYGLSTIKIGTMAYEHEIPAIPAEKATELREHIAYLAGINESNE